MSQQMRVFVSHASQDKAFVDALVRELRGAGTDVWYDEHNLGAGHLLDAITKELTARKVFVVVLSKAAFASPWVRRECTWAYTLSAREPDRIVLPIVASSIDESDFNTLLFLEDFRRIEGPGNKPFPAEEAIERTVRLLGLTPPGKATTSQFPQPVDSVDDLLTHGRAKLAEHVYADALPFFQAATQMARDSFNAWANLGYTLYKLRRWKEALVALERALALNSNNAVVWNNKGSALSHLKRYDEALVAFKHALALDPDSAGFWYNQGSVLSHLKRYDEALSAYDRALALDPNHASALGNKAYSLRALGRTAEAEQAERRAKEFGG